MKKTTVIEVSHKEEIEGEVEAHAVEVKTAADPTVVLPQGEEGEEDVVDPEDIEPMDSETTTVNLSPEATDITEEIDADKETTRRKGRKREVVQDPEIEVVEIILPSEDHVIDGEQTGIALSLLDTEVVEVEYEKEDADAVASKTDVEQEIIDDGLAFNEVEEVFTEEVVYSEPEDAVLPDPDKHEKSNLIDVKDAAKREVAMLENSMMASELMNVYFGMNSYKVDAEGERVLDELVELLKQYDSPVLELHAHADATGDHDINIKLSELRARTVIQYLGKRGIQIDRMSYVAYGESNLYMAQDANSDLNRRVEFRLKDYAHVFIASDHEFRIDGFSYKQLPMLKERVYFVQLAALSDMRTFSTYKLKEYGAAICYYQSGLYKYVLGPFDTMEEATVNLQKAKLNYRDAFIFKNQ